MSLLFARMVAEAMMAVPGIAPAEAWGRLLTRTDTLLLDVRDRQLIAQSGMAAGATPLDGYAMPLDNPWGMAVEQRHPHGEGRARPVLAICEDGRRAALLAVRLRGRGQTEPGAA